MVTTERQREILKCLLNVTKSSKKYLEVVRNFILLKETYGTFILTPTERTISKDENYWETIIKKMSTQTLSISEVKSHTLPILKELTFDLHKLALLTREEYLDLWNIYLLTLTEFEPDAKVTYEVNYHSKMPWLLTILLIETLWSVDEYKVLLVEMFSSKHHP